MLSGNCPEPAAYDTLGRRVNDDDFGHLAGCKHEIFRRKAIPAAEGPA